MALGYLQIIGATELEAQANDVNIIATDSDEVYKIIMCNTC